MRRLIPTFYIKRFDKATKTTTLKAEAKNLPVTSYNNVLGFSIIKEDALVVCGSENKNGNHWKSLSNHQTFS